MNGKRDPTRQMTLAPPALSITQDYMEKFLADIRQKIDPLKTDLKSCLNDLSKVVTAERERVEALEHTVDSHAEHQEEIWWLLNTLKEQHIELQTKQEDLENRGWHNNLHMRGIQRGVEVEDIMFFTRDLLEFIRGSTEREPIVLDRRS
ncbi:hypothetical protein NDU88_000385 [Pleurodeles waltl]|uniref:Uncharacterized protein n=1 Tax=Pleurodeles waltl TaxID=8319 RepID=A0AAV7WIF8_PLEWA|nr:hypothetical protein NDU88_000385 [Pleurodeles waltl]